MTTAKLLLAHDPALLSERQWATVVVELARLGQWRSYHTFNSRRSQHGFPDYVLVKGPRLIFAELKSEVGKTTEEQDAWLAGLHEVEGASKGFVQAYVWKPSDYPEVVEILTGRTMADEKKDWSDYHERRDKAYRKRKESK